MDIRVLASGSGGNCYAVSSGRSTLLLECGIRFEEIRRGLGFEVSSLAGCLISHEHGDHSRSVNHLMRAGVDLYASRGTMAALEILGHRVHPAEVRKPLLIGEWLVLAFEAVHDAAEPLGFVIAHGADKLLYLTDSAYCPYRFEGLTHLLVECNHSVEILRRNVKAGTIAKIHKDRVVRNHMALERLLDMLRANDLSRVREIHLLHLSDQNGDEAGFKAAVQRATGKPVFVAPARSAELA